jgi:hypothetical protein
MTQPYFDKPGTLAGIPGKWSRDAGEGGRWRVQRFESEYRDIVAADGEPAERLKFAMSYDDSLKNGRNEFRYMADSRLRGYREGRAGMCAAEVAATFPEVAGLVRWAGMSPAGPWYYLENTIFCAGDRDCHGLRAGEFRQFTTKEGLPRWELAAFNPDGSPYRREPYGPGFAGRVPPEAVPVFRWVPSGRTGEGKPRELDAARSLAMWPDATDSDLSAEPAELRRRLESRLPALVESFRAEVTSAGFIWESV